MDQKIELPGEIEQYQNFLAGRDKLKNAEIQSSTVRAILGGLLTIIPQEVIQSRILEQPKLLHVVSELLAYQLALNDFWDFNLAARADIFHLTEESKQKVDEVRERLYSAINVLDDPAQAHILRGTVENLVGETAFVEEYIRSKEDVTFDDAMNYRRVVNGIANVAVTSMLIGKDNLRSRLPASSEELTWASIYQKYQWIFEKNPQNSVELAVMVMDRIATVGQLDDDWYGRDIDKLLNIPSPALIALRESQGIEQVAHTKLKEEKARYVNEAIKLGMGRIPTKVVAAGFKEMQRANRVVTRGVRKHHQMLKQHNLLSKVIDRTHLPPRETAYMKGELD